MNDPSRDYPAWPPFRRRLMGMVFATPLYGPTLLRRRPERLSAAPPDPWPGDADRGQAMVDGSYALAGAVMRPSGSPWDEADAEPAWARAMHEFSWLRDLRALGGDSARRHARALTDAWLERNDDWSAMAWRADIAGRRLVAWASQYELFFASAPDDFRTQLLTSMARQARHLSRTAAREVDGAARLAAIKGLLYAGLCVPGEMPLLARAIRLLDSELPRLIGSDGGNAERSPAVQHALLRDLVDMRAALSAGRQDALPSLAEAIARAAPMLRLFRHGDGGLAAFNDSAEEEPSAIDLTLSQANIKGQPASSAPQCGFERLSAGKLLAIVDSGAPAAPAWNSHAHAGTLGFEVSFGKERLIVNCGPAIAAGDEWRDAARATAAHSTLAVEDTNSSELRRDGASGRQVTEVEVEREESEGNTWLSLSHDGYAEPFGLIHRRRLYLAAGGDELRGEDSLTRTRNGSAGPSTGNRAFAIRFHLHPAVRVSLVQDSAAVLLRLPGKSGWRLRVGGAKIDLAESIYFAGDGAKKTQQVVVSGRTGYGTTTVKWALRREGS